MADIQFVDKDYQPDNDIEDFDSDDNEITSDQMKMMKKKKKAQKVMMKDVIHSVLNKSIKKTVKININKDQYRKSKGDNPVLSKFKLPLKKTKQEVEKRKEKAEKKLLKQIREEKGHTMPKVETDKAYENKLKSIAMKGVVKLFNAIHEYQKNNVDEE